MFGGIRMKDILLVSILGLILLAGCTTNGGLNNNDNDVTGNSIKLVNPIQKCEMDEVPYEVQEANIEPYQAIEEYDVDMKYEEISAYKTTALHGFFDMWAKSVVEIRNVDSETGLFTVEQTFETLNSGGKSFSSSQYIMPSETKTFIQEYDIDAGEDFNSYHKVFPAKKTLSRVVTKFKEVTKYKTVTEYRTEEQCE